MYSELTKELQEIADLDGIKNAHEVSAEKVLALVKAEVLFKKLYSEITDSILGGITADVNEALSHFAARAEDVSNLDLEWRGQIKTALRSLRHMAADRMFHRHNEDITPSDYMHYLAEKIFQLVDEPKLYEIVRNMSDEKIKEDIKRVNTDNPLARMIDLLSE